MTKYQRNLMLSLLHVINTEVIFQFSSVVKVFTILKLFEGCNQNSRLYLLMSLHLE